MKRAQVYPDELCKAICQGLKQQKLSDSHGMYMIGSIENDNLEQRMQDAKRSDEELHGKEEDPEEQFVAFDDVSGKELHPHLMRQARIDEIKYFKEHNVYTKVSLKECWQVTGKAPIGVRWVDVNKADDASPNYRSRLVAKDFRRKGEDSIFAPTPPLEALRTILMLAATPLLWAPTWVCREGPHRMQVSCVDISRAYFHAQVNDANPLFVHLPPEDPDYGKGL